MRLSKGNQRETLVVANPLCITMTYILRMGFWVRSKPNSDAARTSSASDIPSDSLVGVDACR